MPQSKVNLLVEGGKATPGPPLGPALAPMGVNVAKIVAEINEKTKEYEGMQIPVTVLVDGSKKTFEVKIGSPPTSALIKKELGLPLGAKGEASKGQETVGDISVEQLIKVAKMKEADIVSSDLKNAVKQVVGTCNSMGITIEGKKAREAIKAIDSGEIKI